VLALGVNVAIFKDGKVLLIQREDFEVWCLPGGEVDLGETIAQAAVREAYEETGIQVRLTGLVGIYSWPRRGNWNSHVVLFTANPVGGELRPQPGESINLRYYELDDLPSDLLAGHLRRLKDVQAGVGGAVARFGERSWPYFPQITIQDIYELRDQSGLSRRDYYYNYLALNSLGEDILEAPNGDLPPAYKSFARSSPRNGRQPKLGVAAAVIRDQRVLLTLREDFEVWCLPGGAVDDNESLAQAAKREIREETGLKIEFTRLVGVYSYPHWSHNGLYLVLFAAKPVGCELQIDPGEVLQAGYYAQGEFPDAMMAGNERRALDALAGLGGGCVWRQEYPWPFASAKTRQQVYNLRDRSGLPRSEFYKTHFEHALAGSEVLEVGTSGKKND